jgi:hypothetical protein
MQYRQYTECASPSLIAYSLGALGSVLATLAAAGGAATYAFIIGALPFAWLPGVGAAIIVACLSILAYTSWWLYRRLACLGGDRCAVGLLLSVSDPHKKTWPDSYDSDYSINLLLAPSLEGESQAKVEAAMQGELIRHHPAVTGVGLEYEEREKDGVTFTGEFARSPENGKYTSVLHCEFEGDGVYVFHLWVMVALGMAIAAVALSAIPVIGWILAFLAALFILLGLLAAGETKGAPTDSSPTIGELHTNQADGIGADILVVHGSWVFDSAHEGYNELHPIKQCQRIGKWIGNRQWLYSGVANPEPGWEPKGRVMEWDEATMKGIRDQWCDAIGKAMDPLTKGNQEAPQNQWTIHPVLDGCQPSDKEQDPYQQPTIK